MFYRPYSAGARSPKVILEAVFKGLVVVTTPVDAIPTVVEDGLNGRLVPPGADALADAITDVISDPQRFTRRSAASLARAAEFTQDKVMGRWMKDLEDAGLYHPSAAVKGSAATRPGD